MDIGLKEKIRQLESACEALLGANPAGMSEHELLQSLRGQPYALMPMLELDDNLGLFRSHFLLFHALYRLRDRLWQEQTGELTISPLQIRLGEYAAGESGLDAADPLREYYLDLEQLAETGMDEVEALLSGFWDRLDVAGEKGQALADLELEEPVTLSQIKAQYRRMVMLHHPDRGGDTERMHRLNDALAVLQRYFR